MSVAASAEAIRTRAARHYYFNSDGTETLALPATFIQGWSARAVGGISATTSNGARLSLGGELGGLASDQFTTWTVKGRATLPF